MTRRLPTSGDAKTQALIYAPEKYSELAVIGESLRVSGCTCNPDITKLNDIHWRVAHDDDCSMAGG